MDYMADNNIVNVLSDGAGKEMVNEIRGEYFTELAKIGNTATQQSGDSVYETVVDAVAGLSKAGEQDTEGLFLIMGADARAAIRKDPLFEASKQGEILYTGQFGTVAGIPCVFSNLVPAKTIYMTEQNAITLLSRKREPLNRTATLRLKITLSFMNATVLLH